MKQDQKKEKLLLRRVIRFLNEIQTDTEWWTDQLLRPEQLQRTVKSVIVEILLREMSFCREVVKGKREDAQTINDYQKRLRTGKSLLRLLLGQS